MIVLNLLFWNLRRNPLQESIVRLAFDLSLDIIILAESEGISQASLLPALNPLGTPSYYHVPLLGCKKIELYARFLPLYLPLVEENHRLSIRHFEPPGMTSILLAMVHLPDKRSMSEEGQTLEAANHAEIIRRAEEKVGHQRTILVGDFNMNPFEGGMIGAQSFHAVMDRNIARRLRRTVQNNSYPFFYNPMWSMLGDASLGAPGTYYYARGEPIVYFWNMFDQVLIRPALLDRFKNEGLRILESDGVVRFRNHRGEPDVDVSDHLPLVFSLEL